MENKARFQRATIVVEREGRTFHADYEDYEEGYVVREKIEFQHPVNGPDYCFKRLGVVKDSECDLTSAVCAVEAVLAFEDVETPADRARDGYGEPCEGRR